MFVDSKEVGPMEMNDSCDLFFANLLLQTLGYHQVCHLG
jgi:hypothetical protein